MYIILFFIVSIWNEMIWTLLWKMHCRMMLQHCVSFCCTVWWRKSTAHHYLTIWWCYSTTQLSLLHCWIMLQYYNIIFAALFDDVTALRIAIVRFDDVTVRHHYFCYTFQWLQHWASFYCTVCRRKSTARRYLTLWWYYSKTPLFLLHFWVMLQHCG